MIYATKPGGDEWYISDGDLKNDSRVEVKGKYKKAGDFHNGAAGGGTRPRSGLSLPRKTAFTRTKPRPLRKTGRRPLRRDTCKILMIGQL